MMDVSGTIISLNDSRISAEVEGRLLWIAEAGTQVAEGDVVARIDDRLLAITLRRNVAALKRLHADMIFREEDVKRFEELAARDNASKARLEEVIARREMLAQDIADAEAAVENARNDLNDAEIRAPFPGHLVERVANKGEYLTVGEEVLRLVDTRNVEVVMPAPIAITPFLEVGDMVMVLDARGQHHLPIKTVVPVGDSVSRMVEVRLAASANDWIVGMPVKVSLPKGPQVTTVAVPRDAIVIKGGKTYVFKVNGNMTAEQVPAEVSATVGLWVALRSGVSAGDKVVIRGGERLTPGQSVQLSAREGG